MQGSLRAKMGADQDVSQWFPLPLSKVSEDVVMADVIANWITAITTAFALAAAIWAGTTARRLYEIEQQRDVDRAQTEERRQAELVAGWVSWTDQPRVALQLPDGRTSRANLALQNVSAVPVYDVEVRYDEGHRGLGTQWFHILSPTGTSTHYRQIKCEGVGAFLAQPRPAEDRVDIRVAISFTDAQGTRWTRETSGRLSKVTS